MNDDSLSIVLPAFNEGDHLADTIARVVQCATGIGVPFEIIVVDDGSTDETWEVIADSARRDRRIQGIALSRNFGKEAALLAGLESSRGRAVVVMDADLQHPPELIVEMYRLWKKESFDVVNARKAARQRESFWHALGARGFYGLFDRLTGSSLGNSSDFKLLDRRVVTVYCNLPERNRFFRGLVSWLGYRQTTVTFTVSHRAAGRTKWSVVRLIRAAVDAIVTFSPLPLHIVTALGILFLVFAVVLGAQTAIVTFMGEADAGFPTVILLILIVGAILMIGQGILGEYQAKIYDEIKSRPSYLVREKLESSSLTSNGLEATVTNQATSDD